MKKTKRNSAFVLSFLAFVFVEFSFCFALQIQPVYPKNKGVYDRNVTSIKMNITSDYDINQVIAYVDNETKGIYLVFDKSDGYYFNDSVNLGQGTHTITIVANDSGGNVDKETITFMVDEEPPVNESAILIDYTANKSYTNGSWYNSTNDLEKIIFHATDNLSGVKGFYLSYNQVQEKRGDPICGTVTLPKFLPANESYINLSSSWIDGVRWMLYRAEDNAGNLGKIKCFVYKLDTQQPDATWDTKKEYYVNRNYLFNVTLYDPLNPENVGTGIESGISGINTSYLRPKIISNCSNLKITLVNKTKLAFNNGTFIYKLSVLYTRSSKEACELILTNATDIAGNLVKPSTIKKTIIVIGPPELKIVSPIEQKTYNKCVWLNISSDKDVESCWFEDKMMGENKTMNDLNSTYAYYQYCPAKGEEDGTHYVTFYCKDENGNVGYKRTEFNIDMVPPTIEMKYPNDGEYTKMSNPQFSCEVSDNIKVKNVTLELRDKDNKTILVLNNESGENNIEYKFYPKLDDFKDGQYYWTCKACDDVNCKEGKEYTFILDRKAPMINEISPENNTAEKIGKEYVDNETEYYIILRIKPIDKLSPKLTCSFDSKMDNSPSISVKNDSQLFYKYVTKNQTNLEGWESWNITCKDEAGNIKKEINLRFYGDDKSPYTNTTARSGWYNKPLNITLKCFDNFKCNAIKYWINGKYNISYKNETKIDLKEEGTYLIKYYSEDKAGLYEKENHTLEINIDMEKPRIKIVTPEGKIFYRGNVKIEFEPTDNIAPYLMCYIQYDGRKSALSHVQNGEKITYKLSGIGLGKQTIYIACKDNANNVKTKKLDIYVYGAGLSSLMQPFGPKNRLNLDKDKNITFSASEGYVIRFLANSQNHTVEITNINGESVTLEFHSKPVEINISEGETKYVDLNGDGINDIAVELLGVYSSMSAKIKIMLLKHKASLSGVLPPQSSTKETANSNLTNNNIQTKNVENEVKTKQIASQKEKEEHKTKTLQRAPTGFLLSKRAKYILVALLILIIFCALYLIIGKKGNKK